VESNLRDINKRYLIDDLKDELGWSPRTVDKVKELCGEAASIDKLLYIVEGDFLSKRGIGVRTWGQFFESLNPYRILKQENDPEYVAPLTKAQRKVILEAIDGSKTFTEFLFTNECRMCSYFTIIGNKDQCIRYPKARGISTHGCGESVVSKARVRSLTISGVQRKIQALFRTHAS
jgi:hypothetical protein